MGGIDFPFKMHSVAGHHPPRKTFVFALQVVHKMLKLRSGQRLNDLVVVGDRIALMPRGHRRHARRVLQPVELWFSFTPYPNVWLFFLKLLKKNLFHN